jgi:class 3 adenylate cyclase
MTAEATAPEPACPNCGSLTRMPGGRCADCMADLKGICPHCQVSTLRLARFCSHCGTAVAKADQDDDPAASGQRRMARRPVAVMFCDLVGSTTLSTGMDAEDFGKVLEAFHTIVSGIVEAHHGFIAHYMGDGALAYFGYPQSGEDDTERAVTAGLALLRAIPTIRVSGQTLQSRIGIALGVVVVGDVVSGKGTRGLDLAGEVPNLAARLQGLAAPDCLLINGAARSVVQDRFDCVSIGEVALKGWPTSVSAWQVIGPAAKRAAPRLTKTHPPFIGRAAEMARLTELWRKAAAGRGAAAVVVGEMGIGKSRLVAEFLEQTAPDRRTCWHWFCSRYLQGVALHPVVGEIEREAGIAPEDEHPARREKLETFLAATPAQERALIIELMAPGEAAPSIAGLSINRRLEMTLAALLNFIRRPAAGVPLLAVFEDFQWADPSSRALLALAARTLSRLNGMLIVTVRPGSEPDWSQDAGVERIDLEALNPAEAASMVAAAAGAKTLPDLLLQNIVARCDGVPLFIEEVTRAVLEEPAPAARHPIPLSIHASLIARLDGLGPARETAEVASVIGRDFTADLLARATGRPDEAVRPHLDRMIASGLIHPAGADGFRFKHALIQDAAYDSLLRERRRALHGKVGRILRESSRAMAETQPQLLAIHFTEAGEVEEAVAWWQAAGMRSLQQSAVTEGLEQLGSGLELLEKLPDTPARRKAELDLLICKGKAHVATSGHASDHVGASFRRARALSATVSDPARSLAATFGEWGHYVTRGPLREAARLARDIAALGRANGHPVHAMFGHYTGAMTDTVMGRLDRARLDLESGIAACAGMDKATYLAPAVGDPKAVMRSYLALIDMCEFRLESCRHGISQALQEARESGLSYSIALALLVRVVIEAFGGSADEGDGDLDALRDFARDRGMAFFEAIEMPLRGWMLARRGDLSGGLATLQDGLARYRDTQSGVWIWTILRMQAQVLGWAGRPEDGLAMLDEADEAAASLDSEFEISVLARVRGELLAQLGEPAAALAAFNRAEYLARLAGAELFARQARQARQHALRPRPIGAFQRAVPHVRMNAS